MIKLKTIFYYSLAMGILLTYYSCHTSANKEHEQHQSVATRALQSNDAIQYEITSAENEQLKTVLVNIHDTTSFYILERSSHLKSFPCTSCHSKSIEQLSSGVSSNDKKAHWDIKLVHGNTDVMNCFTCHNKSNLNELVSLTGKLITINDSFKQCSQCHSTQFKDWVGGGHGKRIGGWVPPKTINTCTNCHSPHKPAFESRWPSRLNTVTKSKIKQEE